MESFASLPEPRRRASCSYPLDELLLTVLCAISSGADDWVEVTLRGQEKRDWLGKFLPFDNSIAFHDTFSRVFDLLDAEQFEACFMAWMRKLCPNLQGQAVHIDGKSLRGSHGADVRVHVVRRRSGAPFCGRAPRPTRDGPRAIESRRTLRNPLQGTDLSAKLA